MDKKIGNHGDIYINKAETADMVATIEKYRFLCKERKGVGDPYRHDPSDPRPALGYQIAYSQEDYASLQQTLRKAGLLNFAELLRFEIFKERPEKKRLVYAPVHSHVIQLTVGEMREVVANESESSVKEDFQYILKHIARDVPDHDYFHMPRFIVTDLPEDVFQAKITQCSTDLIPDKSRALISDSELEAMFNEIPDPTYKQTIKQALEDIIAESKKNSIQPSLEDGLAYTRDGGAHEASHFIAGYFSPEEEKELLKIFLNMRNKLYFKNMTKAMDGIRKYRVVNKDEFPEPSKKSLLILLSLFVNEMTCDYLSIYMKEKASEEHFYKQRHGIEIPPELRKIFDARWADLQKRDQNKTLPVFTEEQERTSKLIMAQRITAA